MTAGLIASLVSSFALGWLAIRLCWPGWMLPGSRLFRAALALPLGAGLSAVLVFAWLQVAGPSRWLPGAELVLLAALAYVVIRRVPPRGVEPSVSDSAPARPHVVLSLSVVAASIVALAAFVVTSRQQPHGDWDAWMNWNMRARMILRAGSDWPVAFTGLLPWSHPDYPPLLYSLVLRSWLYAGGETLAGPALVALSMTVSTVAVLVTALWILRSPNQGMIAGLILLSTPFFLVHGAAQYADVPLGCFLLLVLVFLALDDRHGARTRRFAGLAGFSAGLAVWTKNEGILFVLALVVAHLCTSVLRRRSVVAGPAPGFLVGFAPMLGLLAYFKLQLAPANDLISGLAVERTLSRVGTPERYRIIGREFKARILGFGGNGLVSAVWLLVAYGLAAWTSVDAKKETWSGTATLAILFVLAGHAVVYLTMSDELPRHLNNSLERLLLQLWPAVLFLVFMILRTPEEAREVQAR